MSANDETHRHPQNSSAEPASRQRETSEDDTNSQIRRAVHDLKNWLSGIRLTCDGALMEPDPTLDLREALQQIQTAAEEASRLCEEILTEDPDSAAGHRERNSDTGEMFQSVQTLVDGMLPEHAELYWDVDSNFPPLAAEFPELDRVLTNLVKNAVEALEGQEGVIQVTAQLRQGGIHEQTESAKSQLDVPPPELMVEVRDTGCGMDAHTQSQIFEPSFTTKDNGHGVGLDSVREIVESHDGRIEVQSRPGQGTRVRISLPRRTARDDVGSNGKTGEPKPDRQRILLVDDNRSFRESGRLLLQSFGYEVTTERTAEQALKTLGNGNDRFSVILLDLQMPGLDGGESLKRLQAVAPHLPIIVVSGSTERESRNEFDGFNPDGYLEKPLDAEVLIAAIREATKQPHPQD